jgi:DNA-binding NarL/FixJ family response regulator
VRVVIAEDLALLRDGLTRLFEAHRIEVAAAVDNAPALLRALREPDVDLAVVDVRMPPTFTNEGLQAAIEVRARRPSFPVLVLSQYVEPLYAKELLASGTGAIGYLLKDRVTDVRAFIEAVHQVAGGGTVLDPQVVSAVLVRAERETPLGRLTDREREVLALIAEGRSNAAIAARLFVSEKAVGKHTNSIFAKLDLPPAGDDNRRVLAVLAYLNGAGGGPGISQGNSSLS